MGLFSRMAQQNWMRGVITEALGLFKTQRGLGQKLKQPSNRRGTPGRALQRWQTASTRARTPSLSTWLWLARLMAGCWLYRYEFTRSSLRGSMPAAAASNRVSCLSPGQSPLKHCAALRLTGDTP